MQMQQKSIRLSDELIEYIEQQEGADFSKKLCRLILDHRDGRRLQLEIDKVQMESIQKMCDEITLLVDRARKAVNVFESVNFELDIIRQILKE